MFDGNTRNLWARRTRHPPRIFPVRYRTSPAVRTARHSSVPQLYTRHMGQFEHIDISQCSFDEFVSFLFARDVPDETEKSDPWYWNTEVTFDPQRACEYYVRLFRRPAFLMERFSKSQLEEGFWAIQGPNLSCSVSGLIWNMDLEFATRQQCVQSMLDLFKNLFAVEPLDTSAQMWWDSLCYEWHCGNRNRQQGGEDLLMQDVIFQTLTAILALDSEFCQGAALHGLGHLHHPETAELIECYIRQHPSLTREQRDYALAAARFTVL